MNRNERHINDLYEQIQFAMDDREEMRRNYLALEAKHTALTAERDRYKAALEKYGRHEGDCHFVLVAEMFRKKRPDRCTCGLTEALSRTNPLREGRMMAAKISTWHEYPPIPIRDFDWGATRDGYEPGCPIGWGRTQEAAIADLIKEEEFYAA